MNRIKSIVRNSLRNLVLDILGSMSKPSNGIHLLNGHLLTTEEDLDSNFYDEQLKIISRKATIIPFAEAIDLIKANKVTKYPLLAFSFDDGFEECYSHIAPVLEKYNGYSAFFIPPNFIDGDKDYLESFLKDNVHQNSYKKPMSWIQIKDLNVRGHLIGAHTMDHIRISDLRDEKEIEYQIGMCKKVIESHIRNKCDNFAFTYGHYGRDFDIKAVEIAEKYYKNIFSDSRIYNYFCCENRVINRHHAEPYWKASHINYFLSKNLKY